jgi:2-methylfumaryl-CoA isomerase
MAMESDKGDRARVAGNPIKFRGIAEKPPRYPPALGQDSEAVLSDVLGLTAAEFKQLVAAGVVSNERKARIG